MIKVVDSGKEYFKAINPTPEPVVEKVKVKWIPKKYRKKKKPRPKRLEKNEWKGVPQKKKETGKAYYARYMKSDCWKKIRARTFEADDNRCIICNDKAKIVVHWWYPKIYGRETKRSVSSVCPSCHYIIRDEFFIELRAMQSDDADREAIKEKIINKIINESESELDREFKDRMGQPDDS